MPNCEVCGTETVRAKLCAHCLQKKWRAEHKERCRDYDRKRYRENPERIKEYQRRYLRKHPEQSEKKRARAKARYIPKPKKETKNCKILRKHIEILKDDPNRLSTSFIQEQEEILKRNLNHVEEKK